MTDWTTVRSSDIEETYNRIKGHKGVLGVIIANHEGVSIRSSLDNSTTVQYINAVKDLTYKSRSMVRDLDPQNDLTFIRVRSSKTEIMIAPDKDHNVIVIQNTKD
ncbi:dynein light chain roadblock-type 2-like [Convolutriloba macropyga]|uniref:dynein light chain roadblock-type 2-like n=1 Tax=Convolutriloba macropyga TaxID=536237 RepID=UPI003F51E6E6